MPEPRRNPYVGPKPFEPGEPLFGRDREVLELRYLLTAERIVLLYSPSGAGKSSLVNAGLIPRLQDDFEIWGPTRVNTEPPPGVPNRYVWSSIAGLEENSTAGVAPLITWKDYAAGRKPQSNPLIVFDQFEEILRVDPVDTGAKRDFFEQLGGVLRDPGIWALFILREDYLAPLDPYARLIPTHFQNRYRLDRLTRAGAAEAIEKPARGRSQGFASGVVAMLVQNLAKVKVAQIDGTVREEDGGYVEPVQLQVVCVDLWNRMLDDGRATIASDNVGEVQDALAHCYDDCVSAAARQDKALERQIRDWFGEKLITADGVRNQVRQEPDGSSGGLPGKLVQRLVDLYLVRQEYRGASIWSELAHDRLVEPVRASNRDWLEANIEKFQKYAAQWGRESRPEGLLFLGKDLAVARNWAAAHENLLTEIDREFLAHSAARQKQARRQSWLLRIALGAAFVAAGFGFYAWRALSVAKQEEHKARAHELAARAAFSPGQSEDPARVLYIAWRAAQEWRAARMGRSLPVELDGLLLASNSASYGILRGHSSLIATVSWSPDGKTLASAGWDNTIRLWDVARGQPLRTLQGHSQLVNSVAWSPDGKTLASSGDNTIQLWEPASGKLFRTLQGQVKSVHDLAWSPDGKTLASAGDDGTVRLLDAAGGQPLRALHHTRAVYSVAWSPDGKRLASACGDKTVRLWDAASGEPLRTLHGHTGTVTTVAWSWDGKMLASAGEDQTVRLWDTASGQPFRPLTGHTGIVFRVAWSPDGKTLASASADTTVRLWDAASGEPLRTLHGHTGTVTTVAWSPDGKTLVSASGDNTVRLWDAANDPLLSALRGPMGVVKSVAWNPDGKILASASVDRTVLLWDEASRQLLRPLDGHDDFVNSVAWSPDGKTLASGSDDSTVRLWDVANVRTLKGHTAGVASVAWSPDGKTLVSAGVDKTVRLWDVASGQPLRTLEGHRSYVWSVAWSPDGKTLASASADKTVRLWDVASGQPPRTLQGHTSYVGSVAWSPDGKTLASASGDKTVRLWDVASGQPLRTFQDHDQVQTVAWSPDGKTLAWAGHEGMVHLWPSAVDDLLDRVRYRVRLFSLSADDCQRYFGSDTCPPVR